MSQFERIADQLAEKYPQTASGLRILAGTARAENMAEEIVLVEKPRLVIPKYYPTISENEEYDRQAGAVVNFADQFGINETSSLKFIPSKFSRKLKTYDQSHLTRPLLTPRLPGVSWIEAVNKAGFGVSDYLREHLGEMKAWKDSRYLTVRQTPSSVWIQDGTQFINRKPIDVRNELQNDMNKNIRTGREWVGFYLALLRPDMVENMGWDIIGASVGSDRVLDVAGWDDRPKFAAPWGDDAYPGFRALVCGS